MNGVAQNAQQSSSVRAPERSEFSKQLSTHQLCDLSLIA